MEMEFRIRYRIDGDIPINPAWIRDQLDQSVQALQKKINKKNLHGAPKLSLQALKRVGPPIKNQGSSLQA